ncbi:MAG: hypothetical protein ACLTS6_17885 [Anaerobutyricum sp.]
MALKFMAVWRIHGHGNLGGELKNNVKKPAEKKFIQGKPYIVGC